MALRPASRTLSSLTGILVLAATLWLILNFIYAPEAANDKEWAAARIAELADEPLTQPTTTWR